MAAIHLSPPTRGVINEYDDSTIVKYSIISHQLQMKLQMDLQTLTHFLKTMPTRIYRRLTLPFLTSTLDIKKERWRISWS